MRLAFTISAFTVVAGAVGAQEPQMPTPAEQIALAVQAAPLGFRDGATVFGYNASGQFVRLRAGTNNIICLADDPRRPPFHVACYHRSLEPFMARGRELRARPGGATDEQVDSIRLADVRARRYQMPERAMLYQIFAPPDSVDVRNARVNGASSLYVVYLPYATIETTGLSTDPVRGSPWLMDAGKPWAHIMIGP